MKPARFLLLTSILAALAGCQSAAQHRRDVEDTSGRQMTVGTVQREVREGMSGAEVAQVLGSPNVVTTDENRREVWIYDKVSTTVARSRSAGGVSLLLFGVTGRDSAASSTQKTLTVVIKFDEAGAVRDFAYHTSRF